MFWFVDVSNKLLIISFAAYIVPSSILCCIFIWKSMFPAKIYFCVSFCHFCLLSFVTLAFLWFETWMQHELILKSIIFSNVSLLPHGLLRPTNVSSMIIYSLFPTNCPEQSSFKFRFTNQFKRSAKNRIVRINIKLPNWNSAWL